MKSLWQDEGETSILHNEISKYDFKGRQINLHTFPALCIDNQGSVECRIETKFKRFNENEILDEMALKKYGKMTYEEIYQEKVEQSKKNAFEAGYENGLKDGKLIGKKEIEPILMNMQRAIDEINNIKISLTKNTEYEAVELSIAIAKKIVGNEININKNVVKKIVNEALKKVDGHENIKIKINPDEMQILHENRIELKDAVDCLKDIEIIGDASVSCGGCIVETNIGDIDARIEKQFKVIEDAFKIGCF